MRSIPGAAIRVVSRAGPSRRRRARRAATRADAFCAAFVGERGERRSANVLAKCATSPPIDGASRSDRARAVSRSRSQHHRSRRRADRALRDQFRIEVACARAGSKLLRRRRRRAPPPFAALAPRATRRQQVEAPCVVEVQVGEHHARAVARSTSSARPNPARARRCSARGSRRSRCPDPRSPPAPIPCRPAPAPRPSRSGTPARGRSGSSIGAPGFEPGTSPGGRAVLARGRASQFAGGGSIGAPGFEPGTSPTRTARATRLRHAPNAAGEYRRAASGAERAVVAQGEAGEQRLEGALEPDGLARRPSARARRTRWRRPGR